MRFRVRPSSSERAARTPLHLYDAGGAFSTLGPRTGRKLLSHSMGQPDPGPDGPESFVRPRSRGHGPGPPTLPSQVGGGGRNFQKTLSPSGSAAFARSCRPCFGRPAEGDKIFKACLRVASTGPELQHRAGTGVRARGRAARHPAAAGVPHRRKPTVWRRPSTPRSGRLVASQEQPPPGAGGAAASSTTPADYAGLGSGWDDSPSQRSAMSRAGGPWSRSCALTGICPHNSQPGGSRSATSSRRATRRTGSRPHIGREVVHTPACQDGRAVRPAAEEPRADQEVALAAARGELWAKLVQRYRPPRAYL